jgi:putative two-component system response regulator
MMFAAGTKVMFDDIGSVASQIIEIDEVGASSSELPAEIRSAKIAIIDDEPLNVRLIQRQLQKLGYAFLQGISDPTIALESLENFQPDVVLMDVVMPELSGAQLLHKIRAHEELQATPVIILTASRDRVTRLAILKLGVADFLSKPVDEAELSTRLRNVIESKRYRDRLKDDTRQLERAVRQRTRELEMSQRQVVFCLARAAEYRDNDTGRHVIRVGRYSAILAAALGLPGHFVEMIELAAQLHDVGKIGIPDTVLHKPGPLTDQEMEVMCRHSEYGLKILSPMTGCSTEPWKEAEEETINESPLLVMASRIAASHHERWDGSGYPRQLAGNDIPLEARITAVADTFDALSTPRCYKPAFPLEKCFEVIVAKRGAHFDPQVADACLASRHQFEAVHLQMLDPAGR